MAGTELDGPSLFGRKQARTEHLHAGLGYYMPVGGSCYAGQKSVIPAQEAIIQPNLAVYLLFIILHI
jgi:hypothetical protein